MVGFSMVKRGRLVGALICSCHLLVWAPCEATAQYTSLDAVMPDCLERVRGEEGGGGTSSPYDEIVRRFTEQVDDFIRESERRMAECVARSWPREIQLLNPLRECTFTQPSLKKKGPWSTFEHGTPITGDETGRIDNSRVWISMKDPLFGRSFPINGVGFGFQVHTLGDSGQSYDTLEREGSVVVYYEPLHFMFTCSTDKF